MATLPPSPFDRARRNRRTFLAMIGVGLAMLGLGFASVPLYRIDIDAIGRLSREDFADLQMHHAMELGIYQYSSLFHVSKFH